MASKLINYPNDVLPTSTEWQLVTNTQSFTSPLNGATQTIELPGAKWSAVLNYQDLESDEASKLRGFLLQGRGSVNKFYMFDHSVPGITGAGGGTPLLNYRENKLLYTEDFNNAAWVLTNATWSSTTAVGVFGNLVAADIDEGVAAGEHSTKQTFSVTSGNTYCVSVYAENINRDDIHIRLLPTGLWNAETPEVKYNLVNPESFATVGGNPLSSGMLEIVADGYYRCYLSKAATASGTATIEILVSNGTTTSFTGSVGSALRVSNPVVETGITSPGNFIPTTSVAITETPYGNTIYTIGWTPNITDILKVGDYFQIYNELKMITTNINSDSAGNAILEFEPPIRSTTLINGDPLILTNASCLMRLVDDSQAKWSNRDSAIVSDFSFSCIETFI